MKINFSRKQIEIPVKKVGFFGKISGLMFRTRQTENLLFDFETATRMSFHSFFVFFDFLIIWLDEKNNVIDYEICRPFRARISTGKSFKKVVEVPLNRNNAKILRFFDGKRKV